MKSLSRTLTVLALFTCVPLLAADNPAASINVDANANRRAIDPRIYGLAFASSAQLSDLNVPLNRWGGNSTTRYNWQQNADNRAFDWYFESIAYSSATAGTEADAFIGNTKSAGGTRAGSTAAIPIARKAARDRRRMGRPPLHLP